ncbi:MaoC/PaaZ C-terminal domain-containing protein [Streptomyces sp. NPDC053755]|uniref:MaoC/PaaZ C-terminal domain-containing protein n=1 Tax=Streptomyces sp. NPDC053755 TaxID=3155815 RepID=UPI00342927AC
MTGRSRQPSGLLSLAGAVIRSPFAKVRSDARTSGTRIVRAPLPIDPDHLARYARICGFRYDGGAPPPLTYPHVLGFPSAMRLMTARDFPLPLLGLVHTWITVTRHADWSAADRPEITVHAEGLSPHRRGTEVTMVTEARLAGQLVWESRSGYLARHDRPSDTGAGPAPEGHDPSPDTGAGPAPEGHDRTEATATARTRDAHDRPGDTPAPRTPTAATPAEAAGPGPTAEWHLASDLGRRYAGVSGDRNPIHLHPLTARAFGFPRTVAHGMWTFARCLAELDPDGGRPSARADFKAPVLLPGTVTYATDGQGHFRLHRGGRTHLTGFAGLNAATSARSS